MYRKIKCLKPDATSAGHITQSPLRRWLVAPSAMNCAWRIVPVRTAGTITAASSWNSRKNKAAGWNWSASLRVLMPGGALVLIGNEPATLSVLRKTDRPVRTEVVYGPLVVSMDEFIPAARGGLHLVRSAAPCSCVPQGLPADRAARRLPSEHRVRTSHALR